MLGRDHLIKKNKPVFTRNTEQKSPTPTSPAKLANYKNQTEPLSKKLAPSLMDAQRLQEGITIKQSIFLGNKQPYNHKDIKNTMSFKPNAGIANPKIISFEYTKTRVAILKKDAIEQNLFTTLLKNGNESAFMYQGKICYNK